MSIKAIFFDLDGTLLPMDQNKFLKTYLYELGCKLAFLGYDPEELAKNVMSGTVAMIKNDGNATNEEVFWKHFKSIYGETVTEHLPYFDDFYKNEFLRTKKACAPNPKVPQFIASLKSRFRLVLATNPIFPSIATQTRMAWAGLSPDDFEAVTTYENIGFCKPNPKYYLSLAEQIGVSPNECLMVGNDVYDDLPASATGMNVFILTDCLINRKNTDFSAFPHGNFEQLEVYLNTLK